jgi:general secretion pathway protein H
VEPVVPFHLRAARRAGFTLIELLVVLAILGVVAAAVTLLAPPGDAALAREEGRRLAALLEAAMQESRASGRSIAWSAERRRYAFWYRDEDGDWAVYPQHSVYRPRTLAERTELGGVRLGGREVAPGERVVFAPHGLRSALRATVASANAQFSIEGDVIGRVTLERIHAD